jgi:TetR/AcrR family transcriptional regulator, transcriptional repressor for nem operon
MRYAPEHNDATRQRILESAGCLFRQKGVAGVGLAQIMANAGLTVGTFYTHFKSKEALVRETLHGSFEARNAELQTVLSSGDPEVAIRAYLSPEHRDAPGMGCPVAALASEIARHPRATRQTFASQVEPILTMLAEWLSTQRGKKVRRADAAALLGLLVGTLQLARATPDRSESDAILEAGIHAALELAGLKRSRRSK